MYQKIYDFCKVKNSGSIYKNGLEQTNRVKWIINLLKSNNIELNRKVLADLALNNPEAFKAVVEAVKK